MNFYERLILMLDKIMAYQNTNQRRLCCFCMAHLSKLIITYHADIISNSTSDNNG